VPETTDTLSIAYVPLTDARDGKTYKTVKIGKQTWMAENLNYTPTDGKSWCYKNRKTNCDKYGRLYNRNTAAAACPDGWHLPSMREMDILISTTHGSFKSWKTLKTTSGWDNNGNGTNDYGFSCLPGGYRDTNGRFKGMGTESSHWARRDAEHGISNKNLGLSVRCVKDMERKAAPVTYVPLTDGRDGKTYKTVKMPDGKIWLAENLNYDTANGKGSWCYENNSSKCDSYGRLYNWGTAMAACPTGWHLPAGREWDILILAAGDARTEAMGRCGIQEFCVAVINWTNAGNKLKAENGWNYPGANYDSDGTDDYGFSALPGGERFENRGFYHAGKDGNWWTATERDSGDVYIQYISYIGKSIDESRRGKGAGASVRCVMGEAPVTYALTLAAATGGTVSGVPRKAYRYIAGETVSISASPYCGYTFVNWTGGNVANAAAATTTVTVNSNMTVTANFRRSAAPPDYGALTDGRDGKRYRTLKIGEQTWMAENLNWITDKSQCYDDDVSNCKKYGGLYDWETAMTACPAGWHLPEDYEWDILDSRAGPKSVSGKALKSTRGWGNSGNGSNDCGFSALPGGVRYSGGSFIDAGAQGYWWTANGGGRSGKPNYRSIRHDREYRYYVLRDWGMSVRCVKDDK
jgi:uncharacterized protein (TIGR02145 family)